MADQTLETLADIQSMIDIMSERLVALRALRLQEFIKDEIRSLEGKLLKQFWEQLMVKSRDPDAKNQSLYQSYPSLSKWLVVVGVSEGARQKIAAKLMSLESLMSLSDNEISKFLDGLPNDKEDVRKVCAALSLLRNYNKAKKGAGGAYWDSWKKGTSTNENGYDSDGNASGVDHNENLQVNSKSEIPDQSSENYPSSSLKSLPRFNTTEELHSSNADVFAHETHRTLPHASTSSDVFTNSRPAKSHSRQSSGPVPHKTRPSANSSSSAHLNSSVEKIPTKKTKKRPGSIEIRDTMLPDFVDMLRPSSATGIRKPSQTTSSHNSSSGSPMSPRTPLTPIVPLSFPTYSGGQDHQQQHSKPRFNRFRAFKDKLKDKMGLKRHKSEEHVDDTADKIHHKHRSDTCPDANTLITPFDRDENELNISSAHIANNLSRINTESTLEGDSLLLRSYCGSREDLANSTVLVARASVSSDGDARATPDESEDTEESEHIKMRKGLMRQSSTMSGVHEEWDVPWEELVFQDPIGQGRVGTVYKGKWHGEVAIRVIDVYHNDEQKLRAFKEEVTLYKKTRHDNIELFMGSSINLPKLAIVTSYCRGKSLYQYIRASKDHVNLNNAKIIAQHIAQGMGYLHSRGIVHKDLKSKNVFIDRSRVTITDFGILGLHQISSKSIAMKPGTLQIPDGWLCYMAPEIIRALHVPNTKSYTPPSLPYTKDSDMYAFGTVWYELLTSAWPFQGYSPESIIWQVGNGRKQSLSHFQGSKEAKDILMACWAGDPSQRQEFTDSGVMGQLLRLPQAKIIRRSSQPIKTNKKGNKHGGMGTGDRMFDLSLHSVIHELAE